MSQFRNFLTLSVALLFLANCLFASDTIYVGNKIYKSDRKTVHKSYIAWFTQDEIYKGLYSDSIDLKILAKDDKYKTYTGNFTDCIFDKLYFNSNSRKIPTSFWFKNAKLKNCKLENLLGDVVFTGKSTADSILISGADTLSVSSWSTQFKSFKIDAIQHLKFYSSPRNDTGKYLTSIANSNIYDLKFEISDTTGASTYGFFRDSVFSLSIVNESKKGSASGPYKDQKFSTLIQFYECYINFSIVTSLRAPGTRIVFTNCKFGPDCNFSGLLVDFVIFRDCYSFAKPIPFSTKSDDESLVLQFDNSDYRGIEVQDANHLFVSFIPETRNDGIDNFFQTLLDKFQREGKHNSYKTADINYRYYTENAVLWNWDKYWWDYGYNKGKVFFWTIIILLAFAVFNYRYWDQMQQVYPLFPYKSPYFRSRQTIAKRWLATVLYTAFVFFSISMKLDKLNLSKNRFVIAFFFQHLVGLFLLFFILKAILKW
jgi:hypothetical protein